MPSDELIAILESALKRDRSLVNNRITIRETVGLFTCDQTTSTTDRPHIDLDDLEYRDFVPRRQLLG